MQDSKSTFVAIKSIDEEQHVVHGLVYEPFVLDTDGELMLPEDIELMAHRFMADVPMDKAIDLQHNRVPTGCYPVESYIAKSGDPSFIEGSWVLGVKITDADLWKDIKSGKINGYSFDARVTKRPVVVEIEFNPTLFGETESAMGHTHMFFVRLNEQGLVVYGKTSRAEDGHFHLIKYGTATEQESGHAHRIMI